MSPLNKRLQLHSNIICGCIKWMLQTQNQRGVGVFTLLPLLFQPTIKSQSISLNNIVYIPLTVYQNAPFNMLNSKYFGREQPCCVELWVNNPRATLTPPLSSSSLSILNPYIRPVPYSRMTHESSLSTCQSEAYYARCPKHPGLSVNVIYHLVMCKIRFSSNKQVFMEEGDFVKSKLTASPCMG